MNAFSHEQEEAIRSLIGVWGPQRVVLVGGAALGALTGMSWRTTQDIDLVVMVEPEVSARQLATLKGWQRVPGDGPRWRFRDEVFADILPLTPAIVKAGTLRWPGSGAVMNVAGLDLARDLAIPFAMSDGTNLLVAPLPVIALLKMVSFLDRPHERIRDLADIAWVMHDFVPDSDDRRFDGRFDPLGIPYDEGSAFLLGEDLARIAAAHGELIATFLRAVEAQWLDAMALHAPISWRGDRAALKRQLRALQVGFRSRAT